MQLDLEGDMDRLQEYVDELVELGVELRSATDGLVDFRTQIDDQEAFLCWKLGEDEVGFWHELDGGFDRRHSLLEGAASDPNSSSAETGS